MQWFGMMPATTALFDRLPLEWGKTANALDYNSRLGMVSEAIQAAFEERNVQDVSAAPLPDVPMIVIVRWKPDEIQELPLDEEIIQQAEQTWSYGHENLADQVSDGTLTQAEGSGHMVIIEKTEMGIDAIRLIMNKVLQLTGACGFVSQRTNPLPSSGNALLNILHPVFRQPTHRLGVS